MRWLMVIGLCLLLSGAAFAQENSEAIMITGAWMPPSVEGELAPVHLTLENPGEAQIILTGATTPAAESAVLMQGERELEAIIVTGGATVDLNAVSATIALDGLAAPLTLGDAISLILTFEVEGETQEMVTGIPVLETAPESSELIVLNAWARPTMTLEQREQGADITDGVSAIYMQIANNGNSADRLLHVTTDAAGVVETHESQMSDGIMRMRPVHAIDLPAGEVTELRPGGLHVMLMELQRGLAPGDALLATLTFESGLELVVAVPVYEPILP